MVAAAAECHFFDTAAVTPASRIDGVHLDVDQHLILGKALAEVVAPLVDASP